MAELTIETYEIEEAEFAGAPVDSEEFKRLYTELNLKGQESLVNKDIDEVVPFQKLSEQDFRVWESFCPSKFNLENYKESIIPLKVLGLIKICTEKGYFSEICIRTENETTPDPIVMGRFDKNWFLIARWGYSLRSWEEVVKIAREKWIKRSKQTLTVNIHSCNEKLSTIESLATTHFDGGWVYLG